MLYTIKTDIERSIMESKNIIQRLMSFFTVKWILAICFVTAIFSGGTAIYLDDRILVNRFLYETIDKIDSSTRGYLGLKKAREFLLNSNDYLNPAQQLVDSGLPVYNIKLSPNNLTHFTNISNIFKKLRRKDDNLNVWRKTRISIDGREFKVKIKLHGTASDHYALPRKSFAVKSAVSINGVARFSLLRDGHRISTLFWHDLLRKLKILDARSSLVVVKINNIFQGLYILEERTSTRILERSNIPNAAILRSSPFYQNHFSFGHSSPYDETIFNIESETIENSSNVKDRKNIKSAIFPISTEAKNAIATAALNRLYVAMKNGDMALVKSMIDIERFAKIEAIRMLTGARIHFLLGDNRRLIYDFSVGKFLFYFFRPEGPPGFWQNASLPFERQMYISKILDRPVDQNYLLSFLVKDPEFRMRRNIYLHQYFAIRKEIREIYGTLSRKYGPLIYKDPTPGQMTKKEIRVDVISPYSSLRTNFDVISSYLKYSRVYVIIERHTDYFNVRISADSNLPLRVKTFRILLPNELRSGETVLTKIAGMGPSIKRRSLSVSAGAIDLAPALQNQRFFNGLDDNFQFKILDTQYRISGVASEGKLQKPNIAFVNAATGERIPQESVNVVIADHRSFNKPGERGQSAISVLGALGGKFYRDEVIFEAGDYRIENTLILPLGLNVKLQAGVHLTLGKNVSLVVNGTLSANGTKTDNVVITSLDKKAPFGSVVVFSKPGGKCSLTHTDVSNGSEAVIDGWYSSAALYINGCETYAANLSVHGSQSEDGLNIKNAQIEITDSSFYDNYADQVDLDHTLGFVRLSKFKGGRSSNGDGLDVSGSHLILSGNHFSGFGDKGISVGEASKVAIADSHFRKNRLAVAVKDSSLAYMYRNRFENNNRIADLYVKKNIYSSPKVIWADAPVLRQQDVAVSGASIWVARRAERDFDELVKTVGGMEQLFERTN
jgi:hypothetical protein